jgi:hypothetical protein
MTFAADFYRMTLIEILTYVGCCALRPIDLAREGEIPSALPPFQVQIRFFGAKWERKSTRGLREWMGEAFGELNS